MFTFFLLGSPGVMSAVSVVETFDISGCLVSLELSLRTGDAAYMDSSQIKLAAVLDWGIWRTSAPVSAVEEDICDTEVPAGFVSS